MSYISNKTKLILSITILGIIFTILAFSLLNIKYSKYNSLLNLEKQIVLSTNISKLVHEIQKERGLSIAYVSSKEEIFKQQLFLQRIETNTKIDIFIKQNKKINNNISHNKLLNKINKIRPEIDSFNLSKDRIKDYYSNINATFIKTIIDISNISNLSIITKNIISYSNFLLFKEGSGLERAIGTAIITNKNFTQNEINILTKLITKQNIYKEIFLQYMTPKVKQYYINLLTLTPEKNIEKTRNIILSANKEKILKLDANEWFKQTSLRINKLKDIDDYLAKHILKTIKTNLIFIKDDFINFAILNFIMFVVSILMVIVIVSLLKKEKEQRLLIDKYVISSSTDLEGNIKEVSEAYCNISGYTKEEIIGQQHNIVEHEDMTKDTFRKTLKNIKGDKHWQGQVKNRKKDGNFYWVLANISPMYSFGKRIGYSSIRQDITDNKKIEELNQTLQDKINIEVEKNREKDKQIIQQSRLAQMGEIISMIAHQWRQPLAAISSLSNGLNIKAQLNHIDNETIIKLSKDITKNAQHLSSTIDDFREFFRPNKETRSSSYNEIVSNVLNIVEAMIINNNIKIEKKLKCKDNFNTYPNEIKQVVLNLLKNAEDALVDKKIENPTITLHSYSKNSYSILEVIDNAGGIPEDILENIFDPYFSTKTNKEGTGLGLYMSKTIIEDHCKGKLEVKNLSNGAVFRIYLPQT